MAIKPLSGVKVLDFTAFPPGAYCAVMLADLGAEVIHIDPPAQKGKPSLIFGQPAMSRGKRSLALDLRNPAANAVLLRLAPSIDVVIENARPGSMEARGFGYPQARAANPGIIWCAITGFGQGGPNADHAGHDLSYLAHSGLLAALSADRGGFHPGAQLATPLGGMAAVVGVQGALIARGRSGEGAFVDISLSEAATWALSGGIGPLSDAPMTIGKTPDRRLYACADGRHVAVASAEPRTWSALCEGLGAPELKDNLHKPALAEATAEKIAAAFLARPAAEWVQRLAPAGAAVTLMNHGRELLDDPQVKARGTIVAAGGAPVPAGPVRYLRGDGKAAPGEVAPPPPVGEHTAEVLLAAGFSRAEVDGLVAAGVVA
jgi:crotonobetainyl-CoA:carnitine CoA-transferase CaiB-like acyl-CoA transferase